MLLMKPLPHGENIKKKAPVGAPLGRMSVFIVRGLEQTLRGYHSLPELPGLVSRNVFAKC